MKINFTPYAIVYTDTVDIYDVYFIIIDTEEKTIDCSDSYGFSIANIHYEDCNEIGYLEYDEKEERLNGESHIIIKNGEVVIK